MLPDLEVMSVRLRSWEWIPSKKTEEVIILIPKFSQYINSGFCKSIDIILVSFKRK